MKRHANSIVLVLLATAGFWASARAADPTPSPDGSTVHAIPMNPSNFAQAIDDHVASWTPRDQPGKDEPTQDLTLWNFFSAGWNEEFTRRSSEGRAPDLALLRVQTNFMEREFRFNYFH